MSQRETLPGKRDNISPYEQNKLFDSSKCFLASRDNFCPYDLHLMYQRMSHYQGEIEFNVSSKVPSSNLSILFYRLDRESTTNNG